MFCVYKGIKLSEGSVDQVKEWLYCKSIDVEIIIPPDKDFDIVPLMKDQLIVIMHSNHPLYQKDTIGIPDLQDEDIILGRGGYEVQVHDLFKDFNLKPQI
ncbi:LysR family transcriptional regulator substrate-binding protein [Priestia megaterium]|uniref:LysR family transcriptional regulator substrate-binding protein n=1 Tax=Priestia megaterium TaxID=1404 RepID=UPI002E1DF036|nr:LysR family transcriptional regulator substrate-binding protein [Priestia megaterium]